METPAIIEDGNDVVDKGDDDNAFSIALLVVAVLIAVVSSLEGFVEEVDSICPKDCEEEFDGTLFLLLFTNT